MRLPSSCLSRQLRSSDGRSCTAAADAATAAAIAAAAAAAGCSGGSGGAAPARFASPWGRRLAAPQGAAPLSGTRLPNTRAPRLRLRYPTKRLLGPARACRCTVALAARMPGCVDQPLPQRPTSGKLAPPLAVDGPGCVLDRLRDAVLLLHLPGQALLVSQEVPQDCLHHCCHFSVARLPAQALPPPPPPDLFPHILLLPADRTAGVGGIHPGTQVRQAGQGPGVLRCQVAAAAASVAARASSCSTPLVKRPSPLTAAAAEVNAHAGSARMEREVERGSIRVNVTGNSGTAAAADSAVQPFLPPPKIAQVGPAPRWLQRLCEGLYLR